MSTLSGTTIFIEQDTDWVTAPRFAELLVLDASSSVLHFLGLASKKRTITGFLYDLDGGGAPADYAALVTAARDHVVVNLTTEQGSQGNVYVLSITGQRVQNVAGATAAKKYIIRFTVELMQE